MTLGYSPGVDLSQPIALVLDDRSLGPVTIGWITPAHLADPHATTIPLTDETDPLPGHQSLHRPAETAVVKAGYDGTEEGADRSGGESTDDSHPSPDAGSDTPAKPRAPSFLRELGNSLNPISTAQAAGPEEDEHGFEELQDPMAAVRRARWNYLTARLREIDPWNRFLDALEAPGHVPTEQEIREAEKALDEALTRRDPSAAPATPQSPSASPPLFIRPPGGSPYDVIVDSRQASDMADLMRRRGASEPEIEAAVEKFLRERDNRRSDDKPSPGLSDFEKEIEKAIRNSRNIGGRFIKITKGPNKMASADGIAGRIQFRYFVDFADEFGVITNYSVNYNPLTGQFGVIKPSSGPKR